MQCGQHWACRSAREVFVVAKRDMEYITIGRVVMDMNLCAVKPAVLNDPIRDAYFLLGRQT